MKLTIANKQQKLIAEVQARAMQLTPPPIPFDDHPKKTKGRKDQKVDEEDETSYVTFEIKLEPDKKSSEKVCRKLKVFDNGTPEDYCKWCKDFNDLVANPAYSSADAKATVLNTLLRGMAHDTFLLLLYGVQE